VSKWRDKYIEIKGIQTHYIEAGEDNNETLLLIHGGGASSCAELNYGAVLPILGEHFRVIAVDVVGFGETTAPDETYFTARSQGEFLVSFMDALDLNAHVGGNSHGGWLAQYVAHKAARRVRKLIIINSLNGTSPIPPAPEGLKYILGPQGHQHQPPSRNSITEDLLKFYVNKDLVTPDRVTRTLEITERNYQYARARAEACQSTIDDLNEDLLFEGKHISEFAGDLNRDVLLTWSRENRGSSPADAIPFLDKLKSGEMHVLLHAGHHVMTEHPQRWSAIVMSFLKSE
jgi:pimeloyl-ACP methyl ester carboxylesterase